MRVTANEAFTAVIQAGQMLSFEKGTVIDGDVASYLLHTGAPVTPDEPDVSTEPGGEQNEVTPDEPDVTAKIEDVLAWVGDDPERALEAHAAEEAKGDKARPRLLSKLAELIDEA